MNNFNSFVSLILDIKEPTESEIKKASICLQKITTQQEMTLLSLRYGFNDGEPKTLEETAKELGVDRETIRQTESQILKKFLHIARMRHGLISLDDCGAKQLTISSELINTSLSFRTTMCLKRLGITLVSDLLNVKVVKLVFAKNIGRKSLKEIIDFIRQNKTVFSFGGITE